MGRPRKTAPPDPFTDLSDKTEVLEREMAAQRAAIERLKQIGKAHPQPLRAGAGREPLPAKRRSVR